MRGDSKSGRNGGSRSGLLSIPVALFMALLVMTAVAQPATATTPAAKPATVYSSISSCSVGFAPAVFSSSDTVTMSTTFSPTGTSYRVGADGLGPDYASVVLEAIASPNSTAIAGSAIESMIGLASGAHSVEFYAVDASGAAVGLPLCAVNYWYEGSIAAPEFTGPAELHAQQGVSVNAATGAFTYTPTLAGSPQHLGCTVDVRSYSWVIVSGSEGTLDLENRVPVFVESGGDAGSGLGGANTVTPIPVTSKPLGDGLWFTPSDTPSECGTIWGTPTMATTYTLDQSLLFGNGYSYAATVSSIDAASQTYAVRRTLTLVVEPAATPRFTG